MRRVDLHCYPGTEAWIASQCPYAEALGVYLGKEWVAKSEEQVVTDVTAAGVQAVLVAFDIEPLTGAPPCGNAYVAGMRDRHPGTFIQAWGAVDPLKGEQAYDAISFINYQPRVADEHLIAQDEARRVIARNHGFDYRDEDAFEGWDTVGQLTRSQDPP